MYQNVYTGYQENEVLSGDPIKLVQALYRGALDFIAAARVALAAGDIRTRSSKISDAMAILNELVQSLDHSQQPELCRNLAGLYDYMLRRLIEANVQQVEAPLIEVQNLLADLLGAWQEAGRKQVEEITNYTPPAYREDQYQPISCAC